MPGEEVATKLTELCEEAGVCPPVVALTIEDIERIAKRTAEEVLDRVYGVPELAFHVAEHEATGHGIVVDRALAERTPCKCFSYDTDEFAWSPGVVGLISSRKTPEDFEKFCAMGKEPASPGAAKRFRKLKGAIGEAQEQYEREGGGLPGWWEQVGKTLAAKGIELSSSKASPEVATSKEKMPRINPHATAIQQDKQLDEQMKWLKAHGFKTPREAQEAGY